MKNRPIILEIPDICKYINLISTIGLFVSWLFPFRIQYPFLWIFFISYILDVYFTKRYTELNYTKDKLVFVLFIIYFLIVPVSQIFLGNGFSENFFKSSLEKHLPFLAFGIIGLLGINPTIKLRYIGYVMIAISCSCILYLLFCKIGISTFIHTEDKSLLFTETRVQYLTHHMKANLFFNISLLFSFYIIIRRTIPLIARIITGILTLPIIYILLITEGRTGFVTAIILLGCFFIYMLWKFNHKILFIGLPCIMAGVVLFALHHERMSSTFDDPRMALWNIGIEMVNERPMGYGAQQGRITYVNKVLASDLDLIWFTTALPDPEDRYLLHPHNEFIESTINYGIIGGLVFLSIFLVPLLTTQKERAFYVTLFLFIVGTQFFFDIFDNVPSIALAMGLCLWMRCPWVD